MNKTSTISGFHKMSAAERINVIKDFAELSNLDVNVLYSDFRTIDESEEYASKCGENVIGKFAYFPLRVAPNFKINYVADVETRERETKEYFVPMAIEEPSVVAAASYAAGLIGKEGGFETEYTGPLMIGQIQLVNVDDPMGATTKIYEAQDELLKIANEQDETLVNFGGGAKGIKVRGLETRRGPMVIAHLIVDTRDAMGANAVNTMAEAVAPKIEDITGYKTNLKILSNLADMRLVKAKGRISIERLAREDFSGDEVAERILDAYEFAWQDPYRAATHNKGIMNGIDAVLLATGQDFRAVEAGAHSYAVKNGKYRSLTTYEKKGNYIVGEIEIPMAVGTVGGVKDPKPDIARKILGSPDACEFGQIIGSVGLAQNFGALRALATEGIQKGHMRLHAKNIVSQIDAGPYADEVLKELVKGKVTVDRAKEILENVKK